MARHRLLKSESIISCSRGISPVAHECQLNERSYRSALRGVGEGCGGGAPALCLADAQLQCPPLGEAPERESAEVTRWLS